MNETPGRAGAEIGTGAGIEAGIEAGIAEAAARLRAALAAIDAEIAAYPTPIAGCDAQFNHLLARRRQLRAALNALEAGA